MRLENFERMDAGYRWMLNVTSINPLGPFGPTATLYGARGSVNLHYNKYQ